MCFVLYEVTSVRYRAICTIETLSQRPSATDGSVKALWLYGHKLHLAGSAGTTAVMATINNGEEYIGADVNHDWITAGLISYQATTSVRKREVFL